MRPASEARGIAHSQADLPPLPLYRPDTVEEAVRALGEAPAPAAIYAGGTDFFARLREGDAPGALVWIDRLEELRRIEAGKDALHIGALTTHFEAVAHPALEAVPGLAAAWRKIATVRIRRQATLGGNLMALRPRYELSILLSALGATARMAGAAGTRDIPVEDLWEADLLAHPLLVSVTIPLGGRPRLDYERSMRPTFTQALAMRDDGWRLVMATEYLRPWLHDLAPGSDPAEATAALPADYADLAVGRDHMARAGAAFLKRQIQRLETL